jgi:hypothetical protein
MKFKGGRGRGGSIDEKFDSSLGVTWQFLRIPNDGQISDKK